VKAKKWRKWVQNSNNKRVKGQSKMKQMLFQKTEKNTRMCCDYENKN